MVDLTLLWFALGLGIGALAVGARLMPLALRRRAWLFLPSIGATTALIGGMLGSLALSSFYGTATAVWAGVIGVAAGTWAIAYLGKRSGV